MLTESSQNNSKTTFVKHFAIILANLTQLPSNIIRLHTESGGGYVTENTCKDKQGGDGVQTRELSLKKTAGKGVPYSLLNLPGTSRNCETTEKKILVRHSEGKDALA
ncbi:hypothetical protein RCL_jg20036.t1 [Rhizophagus clarus]|uniref:Uncharacterized protein n=1 Tax=Rhizophagus clarus TaxID=94130 RepID=A0A8H3LCC7_9GLOM|nr:hypothetical protein RCL_jg20036.t1 [Rhizophagus clarus]